MTLNEDLLYLPGTKGRCTTLCLPSAVWLPTFLPYFIFNGLVLSAFAISNLKFL